MNNLKQLFEIQKFLKELQYPDYKRISKEISEYVKDDKHLSKVLKDIKNGKPWEYILGHTEFFTLTFNVNKETLIPRIETEQLVSMGIQEYKDRQYDTVIDVGTGSGCIIISLVDSLKIPTIFKGKISKTKFIATDVKQKALALAQTNAKLHKVNQQITFKRTNIIRDLDIKDKCVLILANLPYIPTQQYKNLDKSVKGYEPKSALEGGKDGNKYYKELYKQLMKNNCKRFTLILETESSIIKETEDIFKDYTTEIIKDCFDKKRFVIVRS